MHNQETLNAFADLRAKCLAGAMEGTQPGHDAAALLLSKIKGKHTSAISKALGALLADLDAATVDPSCAELAHEWMMEHYWGYRVRAVREKFETTFNRLKELGATFEHRLGYGDADYGIWFVESGEHRIIASECYCSCADANINLWIDWPLHFRARNCAKKAMKEVRAYSEYEKDWELGYGDGRDTGYVWDYSDFECRVKDALFAYHKIKWSLWTLGVVSDATVGPDDYHLPKNN